MSNLSPFQANVLHAFPGVTDDAATLDEMEQMFLRGCERDARQAETTALEWERVISILGPHIISAVSRFPNAPNRNAAAEVREYLRERVFRRRFPDGRKGRQ